MIMRPGIQSATFHVDEERVEESKILIKDFKARVNWISFNKKEDE